MLILFLFPSFPGEKHPYQLKAGTGIELTAVCSWTDQDPRSGSPDVGRVSLTPVPLPTPGAAGAWLMAVVCVHCPWIPKRPFQTGPSQPAGPEAGQVEACICQMTDLMKKRGADS